MTNCKTCCPHFGFLRLTNCSRQAMIDEFDLDQDGEINEQELFAIMTDDT
jgi:centrin-3